MAMACSLVVIFATPWGIGLSPDSGAYVAGARSLLRGAGFSSPDELGRFVPIIHFPPLYSATLTASALFGADPVQGARWLAAFLFACNIMLAGALGFAVSRSPSLSVITGLFAGAALPMVQVHTMAWSEPLFISLQLAGMVLLLLYLRNENRGHLILTGILLACGALVRYAGLAMLAAGVVGIVLLSQRRWRDRLVDAMIFAVIGCLPLIAWMVRNAWVAGGLVNRQFSIHPIGRESIAAVFHVVSGWQSFSWLASLDSTSLPLMAFTIAGTAWFSVAAWRMKFPRRRARCDFPAVHLILIVAFSYLLVLLGSISFLDALTPVDTRLLSPLYVPLVVVVLSLGGQFWRSSQVSRFSRAILALCLMLTVAAQTATSIHWLKFSYQNGVGYAGREWRNSETLAKLDLLPPATIIYSNAPEVLYVLRGVPAAMIPRKVDPHTSEPNPRFASEIDRLKLKLLEHQAALIFFYRVNWRWYLPSAGEVEEAMGMPPWARGRDGLILRAP